MPNSATHARYAFRGRSEYIVSAQAGHGLLTMRHSALVPVWSDADVHVHFSSEEFYLLLAGELRLLVLKDQVTLRPLELLMVKAGCPHAVLGGEGPVEHLGLRAPAPDDRTSIGPLPSSPPALTEGEKRELSEAWGWRTSLRDPQNRNCWLVGLGTARLHSPNLCLAYLDFPTPAANADLGTRHRLHLHKQSWEYYTVLQGSKTLRIEDEMVTLQAGDMLAMPPGVKHTLHSRQAPFRGLTIRVPVLDDKVEF